MCRSGICPGQTGRPVGTNPISDVQVRSQGRSRQDCGRLQFHRGSSRSASLTTNRFFGSCFLSGSVFFPFLRAMMLPTHHRVGALAPATSCSLVASHIALEDIPRAGHRLVAAGWRVSETTLDGGTEFNKAPRTRPGCSLPAQASSDPEHQPEQGVQSEPGPNGRAEPGEEHGRVV